MVEGLKKAKEIIDEEIAKTSNPETVGKVGLLLKIMKDIAPGLTKDEISEIGVIISKAVQRLKIESEEI